MGRAAALPWEAEWKENQDQSRPWPELTPGTAGPGRTHGPSVPHRAGPDRPAESELPERQRLQTTTGCGPGRTMCGEHRAGGAAGPGPAPARREEPPGRAP